MASDYFKKSKSGDSPSDPYSVRLLQDVYFLDWLFDAPQATDEGTEIGAIESKKNRKLFVQSAIGNDHAIQSSVDGRPFCDQCRQIRRWLVVRNAVR